MYAIVKTGGKQYKVAEGDVMGVPFAVHPAPASTNAVRAVAARIRRIASP